MRLLALFMLTVCAGTSLAQTPPVPTPAPPAPAPPPTVPSLPEELKKFQGYWKCESLQFDAKEQLPAEERTKLTLVVKGAEYRMYSLSNPMKDEYVRLFTADLKFEGNSKHFEMTIKEGHEKSKKVHGIHEWNGPNFRICYGPADKPRPTKFETAVGSGFFLETWKPEKR